MAAVGMVDGAVFVLEKHADAELLFQLEVVIGHEVEALSGRAGVVKRDVEVVVELRAFRGYPAKAPAHSVFVAQELLQRSPGHDRHAGVRGR